MGHSVHSFFDTAFASLRHEFRLENLFPSLVAGMVNGAIELTVAVAFATLIFAGGLSDYVSAGIGFLLFGSIMFGLIIALTSSAQPVIAITQDSAAAILAVVAMTIVENMPSASDHEQFITIVATISLTTMGTGLVFALVGYFKLGNLVRFIPYTVIGGFLAGTGLLLIEGAISVMIDAPVSLSDLQVLTMPDLLARWFPGLVFAGILLVLLRRYDHVLLVPIVLLSAIIVFYGVLVITGTSITEATDQGWLLEPFPAGEGRLWQPLTIFDWRHIDWPTISQQAGNIMAVLIVSTVGLLLNVTGLELAIAHDIDLNYELKAVGASNIMTGLGGGLVGYHGVSSSVLTYKIGGRSRLPGVVLAAICLFTLFVGGSFLTYFPKPILGGLLLLLGLDFWATWLYDAWTRLPKTDYVIILLIMIVIERAGFLEGIGLGIVVTGILFVINYSRTNVIKYALTGKTFHSTVVRSSHIQALLHHHGDELYMLKLQGFIFFGTANSLLAHVRDRIQDSVHVKPRFVLLDFQFVTGIDSSATFSFVKIRQLAALQGITLIFTQVSSQVYQSMKKDIFETETGSEGDNTLGEAPIMLLDMDHGVEWAEDRLIEDYLGDTLVDSAGMGETFADNDPDKALIERLLAYASMEKIEQGQYLLRQGEPPVGIIFIKSGQVTIQLERDGGSPVRLRKMSAGTFLGEIGVYLNQPATASVITDTPVTINCLSIDALRHIEQTAPELISMFHNFMARFLAKRLTQTTETLDALIE